MKKFNLFKMLAVLIVLITSINTAWAERWVSACNIKYYTHNGFEVTKDGWYNETDGINIASNNVTLNFGNLTAFYLKQAWGKASHNSSWGSKDMQMVYGFSADNQTDYKAYYGPTQDNPYTCDFPISEYNVIGNAPNNPGQNTLYIYFNLNFTATDGGNRTSKTLYINFTIPGFRGAPASKAFGTIPVNKEAETTISFNHYGNALEAEDFVITGSSDFTVRSFSESGVNIVFNPTTTGSKSATLTITDDYDNRCTISLTGTAAAAGTVGTVTTLYFNDYRYDGAGDWAAASAKYRFVCAYTDGVYTHYNMTKCPNTEHTYTADVEIKAGKSVSIDRYNPSSPYEMWNSVTPSDPGLSSTNPYAKSTTINGAYATNHPINDVGNRKIYYDNSASGFTNTLCVLIGRDKQVSDDGSSTYSKAYKMSAVTNTKLYYCAETASTDNWHDVTYYAVIGTSSDASTISGWSSSTNWGSSSISTKGNKGYTAAYTSLFGLIDGNVYLASSSSYSGGAMTINKCASTTSSFNSTQTFKYALATGGTAAASASLMNSGSTPATITIASYKFTDGTYNSVGASSSPAKNISAGTSGTYSKDETAGYTATTTITVSNINESYRFKGFYTAAGGGSQLDDNNGNANDYVYYPKSATTIFARFVSLYSVSYDINGGTGTLPTKGAGSHESGTNVTLGNNNNSDGNGNISKTGYTLTGWNTDSEGKGDHYDLGATITAIGANKSLYAEWTANTFAVRFNANGGSGTMADQEFTYEVSQNLTANAFTKAGYYFEGWAETADGSVAVSDGADGSTLCTTNGGTKNLYAVWTAATSKASGCWVDDGAGGKKWNGPASGFDTPKPTDSSLSWSTANWAKGTGSGNMPTIETQVVIPEETTITIAAGVTATAKEIVLGLGAKLYVEAGGALILGGSVNVGGSATTKNDLILSSDGTNGSAALISSEENTSTAATVEFYTKATYNSAAAVGAQYVNQYFGIPFDEVEADIYDETEYVYEFKVNENKWEPVNIYGTMTAFTAYNLLRTSTSAGAIRKSGTLNLPGTTTKKDKVLTLTRRAADVSASKTTTNMFANSWTAPINIASMVEGEGVGATTPNFVGVEATIYIFNAGTYKDAQDHGTAGSKSTVGGQWISLPVKSVKESSSSYDLTVIPSQQAFLVYATGGVGDTHTLTLDYNKHVYAPAKAAADADEPIGIAPAKAPKRTTATNNDFMAVNVSGESGYSDRVMIFMDGKFSEGFDNGWDGRKLSGKGYTPQLYALTSDGKMAVNSVPTVEGTVLGFKRGSQDTNYTISFEYNGDEEWYLNDTEEQISTLINEENSYEFTTSSDDDVARFVISATPIKKITTGTNTVSDGVNARKLMIDGQLYIIRDGRIYNAEGALMK